MANIPLTPVGSDLGSAALPDNPVLAEKEKVLEERRKSIALGWGQKYIDRVHKKGKLTSRERIELLKDPGSDFHEIGSHVNGEETFYRDAKSPGAGVVTGIVRVHDRLCVVIANDNTVASGAWWPRTPEKIQRAQTVALRLRLPVIYLVDCSGLFLPEQSRTFAGERGAGNIFKLNSVLSANGVPQLAGVFGDCIAGGGYMPIISDRVYMTEQAYMVIAGAALIKGAKSQKMTSLGIGGPEVHVHQSGCADVRVPDDQTLISSLRGEIKRTNSSAADYYRGGNEKLQPNYSPRELKELIPADHRQAYNAEDVIARLVDESLFWEIQPNVGREMIVGVGRIGGLYVGIICNRQGPMANEGKAPTLGGILYRDSIAKISSFSRACNDDGIPIVWLQDISGFDIGAEAERLGLLRYGSSLIYTNSTNTTPMFTFLLRKASGAGYYAMAGMPFDPVLQLSTTISRLSVMEGRTLAIATYNTKLDDNFEIATDDPDEKQEIEKKMKEVEARIESDMSPYVAANKGDIDEIIKFDEMRGWLEVCVEASYQSSGYRRIKNPRIWSLHDIAALDRGMP